ncbi:MAG: peptidylprolyl isomerase FKBP-type [Candidatus Parvarchaeum acidophilus ARMAN-5]|jgi:peptidylprolyl isomerase|uniref:Peptidyl-prolyl cis-trans isomerase n=1 Tax=Candidatus Parvarchaeum acidophilus ARMAN-5 TaxID=662762 RepID=D6GUS4_PARA5|nr:MAG: peptidylprolyl isomerase FKBP-type [Candidatus Parvarchaeum acidophilus ARMAN-5]
MENSEVKKGDKIKVIYTGYLEDGSIFDSNKDKEPLSFEVGSGYVIKGFDDAVMGMKIGEKKVVDIPSDKAYGDRHDDMVIKIPKTQFEGMDEIKIGTAVSASNGMHATIIAVDENEATLDFNFPLAGKNLKFEIEVVAIN